MIIWTDKFPLYLSKRYNTLVYHFLFIKYFYQLFTIDFR